MKIKSFWRTARPFFWYKSRISDENTTIKADNNGTLKFEGNRNLIEIKESEIKD